MRQILDNIILNGCDITAEDIIKVLGVKFKQDLTWDIPMDSVLKKGYRNVEVPQSSLK